MKTFRKRASLYLAEAGLIAVLLFLPVDSALRALTIAGLFAHLTTSLGWLLLGWRSAPIGPGPERIFGVAVNTMIKCIMAAGIAAMASWPLLRSDGAWVTGVLVVAWGIESLLVYPKQNPEQVRVR